MTAPSKPKWRERLALIADSTYPLIKGFFPGQDRVMLPKQDYQDLLEVARSVVAAYNAQGAEPVVWGWTPTDATWEMAGSAGLHEGWHQERSEQTATTKAADWKGIVVPLFTSPQPDPADVVERLRAEWQRRVKDNAEFATEFEIMVGAADEIIAALKESGRG